MGTHARGKVGWADAGGDAGTDARCVANVGRCQDARYTDGHACAGVAGWGWLSGLCVGGERGAGTGGGCGGEPRSAVPGASLCWGRGVAQIISATRLARWAGV